MVTFYVKNWYPNTPKQDRDPAKVKWELYEKKGSDIIKLKTFKEGKLQFSEKEIGKQYIVVGYLYEPELNNSSAMKISVVPTEKVQILSVEVRDINGNKITKPLAYGQKIKVSVRTTGLQGAKLNIDLWEDDATGSGHNQNNTKVTVASQLVAVGKNGIATTEMVIPLNFKKFAEAQGDIGKESAAHEYYVTAYHDGTQRVASGNIDFTNTKTPEQRKQETRDHLDQKPKKKEPIPGHKGKVPKTPPAQQQPTQPRTVKKQITSVYITDSNNKAITGTVKGGIIKVHILSTGLIGREIRFKLYEEDITENQEVINQKFKIDNDHYGINVTLKNVSASKGDDFFEGSEQEFFVDIEVLDTHAHIKSAVIDVDVKALKQDIPTNVTKTKVEQQEAPNKDDKKENECPRCKILSEEEMTNIFTGATNEEKNAIRKVFNIANKKFGLDTCQQKAHFFAQVLEEIGVSINVKNGESLNYKVEDLPKHFSRFSQTGKRGGPPNDLARRYGRIDKMINGKKVTTQKQMNK